MNKQKSLKKLALSVAIGMLFAAPAMAQLSTATIKGTLIESGAPATHAVQIIATNTANGFTYRVKSDSQGHYVLNGLAPGNYVLSVEGSKDKSQEITVSVGQTSTLDLALSAAGTAADGQRVEITGTKQRADVINSQVGTSVSAKQIENLPQNTRNFLAFADLAPGVRFDVDSNGYTKLSSGSGDPANTNVFIDGVSQKNQLVGGMIGVGGTNNSGISRGNPFPQSAIGEYQVISQNYKAEFDQVSNVAITATTKSGTNETHGEVFWDHTGSSMQAYDPFQKKTIASGGTVPSFTVNEYGATIGGAIKQDVAHYFLAYEGKNIGQPHTFIPNSEIPNIPGSVASQVYSNSGSTTDKFKENLLFGKVDFQVDSSQRFDITTTLRKEDDVVPEGSLSTNDNTQNHHQTVAQLALHHSLTGDDFLNEAKMIVDYYNYFPHSDTTGPEILYYYSPTNTTINTKQWAQSGSSPNEQQKTQRAFTFSDDFTYTAIAAHNIKTGFKIRSYSAQLGGTYRKNNVYSELIDPATGNPILGLNSANPSSPYYQTLNAVPESPADFHDNQLGLYIQDDWKVNKKLELNYGVRWDYESNMLNNNYVTPADRVAMLDGLDNRTGAPTGQTYAQSLAKGGIYINDYISTGNSYNPYKKAFAPRLGFSYDLNGDKETVIFGGIGRSYDHTVSDFAIQQKTNNAAAGGDTFLIDHKSFKMPFSDQFSLGIREALGRWNAEGGLTFLNSKNQFQWFNGNRDPNGGTNGNAPFQPYWGSQPGFGNLVLGNFEGEDKTWMQYVKLEKPWTKASGWSFGATLTHTRGETNNSNWTVQNFNWSGGFANAPFYPDVGVEDWRLVANGVTDGVLPYGIMLSGKFTWGSGLPYQATNGATGAQFIGSSAPFRQFDVGFSKDMNVGFGKFTLRGDIINLFNTANYGGQNSYDCPTCNFGQPTQVNGPMRTVKVTARYTF